MSLSGPGGCHAEPRAGRWVGRRPIWTRCWNGGPRSSEETHMVPLNSNTDGQPGSSKPAPELRASSLVETATHTGSGQTR